MMRISDLFVYTSRTLQRQRFRSAMLLIAMAIGITAVVTLTSLGEGAKTFVLGEFSALGKDTLIILPGRKETTGGLPPITGTSTRDITLNDAVRLKKAIPGIEHIAPLVLGTTEISYGSRSRETLTIGTSHSIQYMRDLNIDQGNMLPKMDITQEKSICVIGQTIKQELFHNKNPIGKWLRAADRRYRVIGVLKGKGDSLGMDLSDSIMIPVASSQALFNVPGLFRVMVKIKPGYDIDKIQQRILQVMKKLHQGEEDITLISPDALLNSFSDVFNQMTMAVTGIAAISLLVSGILIMNVTLISVNQRVKEIGLLKAIGASTWQIRTLFLTESASLALLGAFIGIIIGEIFIYSINQFLPIVLQISLPIIMGSILMALITGLVFALIPANKAAAMQPVTALNKH